MTRRETADHLASWVKTAPQEELRDSQHEGRVMGAGRIEERLLDRERAAMQTLWTWVQAHPGETPDFDVLLEE